ncbi:uncharacterized protein N7479_004911 [Penicillium vulpinum]|uniref:Uncharacterized protein n=1 Tax=Penicillium vulpinum TaxID=29845 RepID=A0A1V6RG08_9EURO|nr:uncharacterized protein N7479_004911 [Penicillium vulpinum]KAJ5965035.1 hypothetical protein N7479_004911 [Penicillium vulpinum]OQE00731.1 hypothetical protein PENVUL_c047G04927 [Penicillium vulpinum]
MRTIKELWFNRPAFTRVNSNGTPEKKESAELATESSPLTEPPSSFVFDQISPESEQDAEAHVNAALYLSTQDTLFQPSTLHQSFQSIESATGFSSLSESFNGSQRIIKDGKEIVISSDGEDTDSICSLEDPKNLFAPKSKKKDEFTPAKFPKILSPKKYRHNIDSLVHDAVDDNEVEASVARARANYAPKELNGKEPGNNPPSTGYALNETMLISALGENEDGVGGQHIIGAIRRTNALDRGRAWPFFDCTQTLPPAPQFPKDLFAPGTSMDILRESDTRERQFMSGEFIQMALSKGLLPDEFILWMFRSIPYERREELSNAYYRIIKNMDVERLRLLIRPADINDMFSRLGARSQALDPSKEIIPVPSQYITPNSALKDHVTFVSVLRLLRETAGLFAEDTQEQVVLLLLRLTLDVSLTADSTVSSELQWTINAVLDPENFQETSAEDSLRRVCANFYNTVHDVCIQSQIVHHILPTSPWFALIRCRLAVAFLLPSPDPLTEPLERLLDIKRITLLLLRDERFQVERFKGIADYDWRELTSLTALLNVAIDSSALEVNFSSTQNEEDYNAAIDRLAAQIKKIFCSIQDSGASHVTRTVAKSELEALHYRIVYSVRSKPPPKTTIFESHVKQRDGNIRSHFSNFAAIAAGKQNPETRQETNPSAAPGNADNGDTEIPIRVHDQTS